MYIQIIQQFSDPLGVNCNFTHGCEGTCAFGGDFIICFASEGWLKLPITNVGLIQGVSLQNSVFSKGIDPRRVFFKGLDK